MVTVRVVVTEQDMRNGVPWSPLACPVVRALRRATGQRWTACHQVFQLYRVGAERKVPAPEQATRFMRDYDGGKEVEPFAFDLDVPDEWLTA
jgi:hypothetical protein